MATQPPLESDFQLLDYLDLPALLVGQGRIMFANQAASNLLGHHIQGQDIRLAIRHPAAIALIVADKGGSAVIEGLSVPGSRWSMDCMVLTNGLRLLSFRDVSAEARVARAHTDFVANASHELRTPLAAVLGYVETLRDPKAWGDEATRTRFLDVIEREAKRMQGLVEDLMSLSRVEALKHEIPLDPVDLGRLVHEVGSEWHGSPRLKLVVKRDDGIVSGDAVQLAQVMRNLIDNAFKYGAADTPVTLTLNGDSHGWVKITIHNEGPAISPEHLPRLTQRFYRVDAGRSRDKGGTGLGLAIVKHCVERHRGRFDITSWEGEGTTATVILPVQGK